MVNRWISGWCFDLRSKLAQLRCRKLALLLTAQPRLTAVPHVQPPRLGATIPFASGPTPAAT